MVRFCKGHLFDWVPAFAGTTARLDFCFRDRAKIQHSSFLTPLTPLIRGELSRKPPYQGDDIGSPSDVESPPDKGDLGGWVGAGYLTRL